MLFFFPPGWSTTGEVMTYLPQLGRSQSGTGGVLTQCPSKSFSVSNFCDYVVTGSVKRTMKNTITRKPCSFPRPFVSLRDRACDSQSNRGPAVFTRATEKGAARRWDPSVGKPDRWLKRPVTSRFAAGIQMYPGESSDSSYLLLLQRRPSGSSAEEGL